MDFRRIQADIMHLLADSPIVREEIKADVKTLVYAGEIGLAFDTLCSWIYEDSLPISRQFYERLHALAGQLEEIEAVDKLDELIAE